MSLSMPIPCAFPAISVGQHAADAAEFLWVSTTVELIGRNRYRLIRVEPEERATNWRGRR